jgi:hypothetical protein
MHITKEAPQTDLVYVQYIFPTGLSMFNPIFDTELPVPRIDGMSPIEVILPRYVPYMSRSKNNELVARTIYIYTGSAIVTINK